MNTQENIKTSTVAQTLSIKPSQKLSDTSSSSPVVIPTPSVVSEVEDISLQRTATMKKSTENSENRADGSCTKDEENKPTLPVSEDEKTGRTRAKNVQKESRRTKKKTKSQVSKSSSSGSSDTDADSESDSSEEETAKSRRERKAAAKRAAAKKKSKAKLKSRKYLSTSSEDDSSSASDSDEDQKIRRSSKKLKAKAHRKRKNKKEVEIDSSSEESSSESSSSSNSSVVDSDLDSSSSSSDSSSSSEDEKKKKKRKCTKAKVKKAKKLKKAENSSSSSKLLDSQDTSSTATSISDDSAATNDFDKQITNISNILKELKLKSATAQAAVAGATPAEKSIKKNALEFKRVDKVWDTSIHDWKLVESNAEQKDEFDCVFTVVRRLDWDGKYRETQVVIKSKLLRHALQQVFKEYKSFSLVEDAPEIDPRCLFHCYGEIKSYIQQTLKPDLEKAKKTKSRKKLKQEIAQCKLLLTYLDEDFKTTRKALKPLLKAGTITYDLVWALFKPNTIAFSPTYQNNSDPRCFKVDFSYEHESWLSGMKSCVVEGSYLEYDGKAFGLGDHQVQIQAFKGHKKITSLAVYPLKYHQNSKMIKKQLIERGKKFVALQDMNYRLQNGIAYMKHKNSIVRFNINGRVMIDPAIFRRVNPNYQLSCIKHDELDQREDDGEDDEQDGCCCSSDEDQGADKKSEEGEEREKQPKDKLRTIVWKDRKGKRHLIQVSQSDIDAENRSAVENGAGSNEEDLGHQDHVFTEEELLIASPVVLGFAFSEKLWLEFSLSGITDIQWNEGAFHSLVLPDRVKQNLKGLVSSHRYHAARTIDDVIRGKGKGLNIVLHGPPGVGKTLTAESIAEFMKCPLYAVSAGELGTNSRSLEQDLNRIMDITHSWGAILLLDEADVFLEARQPHDIHRNSLVSVFLRLTEYYQGILFLTTNRVETFDEAFQSRIHMGIRYENLMPKARKQIWMHHVGKAVQMDDQSVDEKETKQRFTEANYEDLSKRVMNGRQIKNTVKTSQSIALAEKVAFSMEHIRRVLEVAEAFEDDMRGGKGFREAMRQYT